MTKHLTASEAKQLYHDIREYEGAAERFRYVSDNCVQRLGFPNEAAISKAEHYEQLAARLRASIEAAGYPAPVT